MKHWCVLTNNQSHKKEFIDHFIKGLCPAPMHAFSQKKGHLFSAITIQAIIAEEAQRDYHVLSTENQSFKTMSSGEQKKALLYHLLESQPDYMILDNPFDNLDHRFQEELKAILQTASKDIAFIQLASRKADILAFTENFGKLEKGTFSKITLKDINTNNPYTSGIRNYIPTPLEEIQVTEKALIVLQTISVSFLEKPILKNISWTINKGDFWQLIGENGSGKSTLLSMITGDNPKAYNQEIYLFGKKKGSGETVWDIKKKIGYYTPSMTDAFNGRHTVENMLISGFTDSIGLYTKPTEMQKSICKKWLDILNLKHLKDILFCNLSLGQQRLVMTARAMVKHPPVLILDEPTAGMDDASAEILVALVNKIAKETSTAIIFVSHRKEPGLATKAHYVLEKTPNGSIGMVKTL